MDTAPVSRPYRVNPEDCLAAFDERDDRAEPLTSSEVAAEIDIARRTAYKKLEELVERDELRSKQVGSRGRVWWIPDPRGDDTAET